MGLEQFDDVPRLARAGEYWRVVIGDDERFAFGEAHSKTKYAIVMRDVLAVEHERMVPAWICTLLTPGQVQEHVDAGLNVAATVVRFESEPCDVAIDIMKPISFDAGWFGAGSGRAERLGTIDPDVVRLCLAQQAIMMQNASLGLRPKT